MLTEEERMNNAFKEMLFAEEQMAKKYSSLTHQITDPQLQKMLKEMEQSSRNQFATLSDKMQSLNIKREGNK
jgi:ferritin-like metal-binding protein YciE